MQSFRLLQGTGLTENSKILGISGFSGSIGSTARYSEEILTIESRLEDPLDKIIEEFNKIGVKEAFIANKGSAPKTFLNE